MFGVILISFGLIMCHGNLIQIKTQRGRPLTRPVNTLVQQGHQDNAVDNENKLVHRGESCTIPPEHDHRRGNIWYSSEQLLLFIFIRFDKIRPYKDCHLRHALM